MATQNITITTATGATPDNPSLHRSAANGDNAIQFQSGGGTHTVSNLPNIFTTTPPDPITVTPGSPSETYTIDSGATDGEYSYTVDGGSGLPGDGKSPQIKVEP
jgi:hypothetical protein